MHPRESIPNVGRRAQGRKTSFTVKGNGMEGPSPSRMFHAGDQRAFPVQYNHSAVERRYEHSVNQQTFMAAQPTHPYNRIVQRILHRRQGDITTQLYDDTIQAISPRDVIIRDVDNYDHAKSSPSNFIDTRKQLHIDLRSNRRSREKTMRTDRDQRHEMDLRWKGSTLVRSHLSGDENPNKHARRQSRPTGHSGSTVDMSGGCLTGRNPVAFSDRHRRGDMSDTASSEVSDTPRTGSDSQKMELPSVMRVRNTESIDDLLDYYWVYQGMGRQVLNLDIPHEVWEKKLFKKHKKLPPIGLLSSQEQKICDVSVDVADSLSARGDGNYDSLKKVPSARRTLSEPVYINKSMHSQLTQKPQQFLENRAQKSFHADRSNFDVERQDALTRLLSSRSGRTKLVVMMPVLTQEKTYADMLETD